MKAVWVYVIAFHAEVALGIIVPILPIYAKGLGSSVFLISAIVATPALSRLGSELYLGDMSDRKGRRPILILQLVIMSIFPALIIKDPYPELLVPIALVQGVSASIFGTVAAAAADVSSESDLDTVMGTLTMVQGLGNAVGSIIGGYTADRFGFYSAFALTSIIAVSGLSVAIAYKGIRRPEYSLILVDPHSFVTCARSILKTKVVLVACVLATVFFFAQQSISTFFPLQGREFQFSETQIGVVLGVRSLSSTVVRLPIGYFVRSLSKTKLLYLASCVEVISIIAVAFASSYQSALLAVAIQGIGYGTFLVLARTITTSTDTGLRGMSVGIFNTFGLLGQTILLLALGGISYWVNISTLFLIGSLFIIGGIITSGVLSMKVKA